MTAVPQITLNNGQSIPQLGFGVFQIEPADTVQAVSTALQAGYRHIDTAQMYGNEKEVGAAIAKSGLDRSDVFVTSKLANGAHLPDDARRAFDASLEALGFAGRARSIGVSNFQPHHLRRLHQETEIPPAVNQIEVHPFLTQDEVRGFCMEHGIAIEAWSPIGQGVVLDDPVIVSIARQAGKTPAQVVLRWHIQRGDIVFPKSVTPSRIEENFSIFDFELSGGDVAEISALNKDERTGPDPDKFDTV